MPKTDANGKCIPRSCSMTSARRSEAADYSSVDAVPSFTSDALFVGVAGTVKGTLSDELDADAASYPLTPGIWPLSFKKIFHTGTDSGLGLRFLYGS